MKKIVLMLALARVAGAEEMPVDKGFVPDPSPTPPAIPAVAVGTAVVRPGVLVNWAPGALARGPVVVETPAAAVQKTPVVAETPVLVVETPAAAAQKNPVGDPAIKTLLSDLLRPWPGVDLREWPPLPAQHRPNPATRPTAPGAGSGRRLHFHLDPGPGPGGSRYLTLQLLQVGHPADAAELATPLAQRRFTLDPRRPEASRAEIQQFLQTNLGPATAAAGRPSLQLWTEPQSLRAGQPLQIHFQTDRDAYLHLFQLRDDGSLSRLVPGPLASDNYLRAGQLYRLPSTDYRLRAEGRAVKLRAILTLTPSGPAPAGGVQPRQAPLVVIPSNPPLFGRADLSHFFPLPVVEWNVQEFSYEVQP